MMGTVELLLVTPFVGTKLLKEDVRAYTVGYLTSAHPYDATVIATMTGLFCASY